MKAADTLRMFGSQVGQGWAKFGLWMALAAIAVLAFGVRYQLTFNTTPSLPIKVAIVERGNLDFQRGDLIALRWESGQYIPKGLELVKRVVGMPGDEIKRVATCPGASDAVRFDGCMVVAQHTQLPVRRYTRDFLPLAALDLIALGAAVDAGQPPHITIPREHYFVKGDHLESLDSRYAALGLVRAGQIVGKVVWSW